LPLTTDHEQPTLSEFAQLSYIPAKQPNDKDERHTKKIRLPTKTPQRAPVYLPLLRRGISLLLAMPVRFQDLPVLYGRKHMGYVLQCHHLAVPGLRGAEWVR